MVKSSDVTADLSVKFFKVVGSLSTTTIFIFLISIYLINYFYRIILKKMKKISLENQKTTFKKEKKKKY